MAAGVMRARYNWVVALMSSFTDVWVVRAVVALASFSMGLAVVLEIVCGYGARTPIPFWIQVGAGGFAFVAALAWLVGRWPSLAVLFGFVVVSDVAVLAAIFTVDLPPAIALGKTAFLIPLGLLAGFFLTDWMFAVHLAVTVVGATAVAVWAVYDGGLPIPQAFFVWQPVVVVLVGPPVLLLILVRSARVDQLGQE